jgi:multiple sugar transport system permease protein
LQKHQLKVVAIVGGIFLVIWFIFIFFPIYWMFNTAFKTTVEVQQVPPTFFPKNLTTVSYRTLVHNDIAMKSLRDSLLISVSSTLLAVFFGSLAGYAFARWPRYAGGENLSFWILSVRMFPAVSVILPIFFIFNTFNLLDTYFSLIVTYLVFNLPLAVWLMMMFFGDVPVELEEACYVDGYSPIRTFFRVTLPLVKPGLVSVVILCWIFAWNEFLFAHLLVGSKVRTFPIVIPSFTTGTVTLWNETMAFTGLVVIPPIVLFIVLRKYMIRGLSLGVVKG